MASTSKDGAPTRTIGAVETSCQIIECLHATGGARIRELVDHLDVSKGAIHTHLATLRKNGYVVQNGHEYRVSLRFLEIGESARTQMRVMKAEKGNLHELAEETDTRIQLVREEFGMSGVLEVINTEPCVEPSTHVGMRNYLHSTAAGKAILAYLPPSRVESIIDKHGLPAQTENTITDREMLFDELETIRERGVAFNDEEKIRGLRAVGAPILTDNDQVIGAVSASAPVSDMQSERFRENIPSRVLRTANAIELNVRIQGSDSAHTEGESNSV